MRNSEEWICFCSVPWQQLTLGGTALSDYLVMSHYYFVFQTRVGTKQPVIATASKRCHAGVLAKRDSMGGTFFGCRGGGRIHPSFILPLTVPHTPIIANQKQRWWPLFQHKKISRISTLPPKKHKMLPWKTKLLRNMQRNCCSDIYHSTDHLKNVK